MSYASACFQERGLASRISPRIKNATWELVDLPPETKELILNESLRRNLPHGSSFWLLACTTKSNVYYFDLYLYREIILNPRFSN